VAVNKLFQVAFLDDSSYTAITEAYKAVTKASKGFKITIWRGEKPYCCFKRTENPSKNVPTLIYRERRREKYVFVVTLGLNTCFGDLTGMVCRPEK